MSVIVELRIPGEDFELGRVLSVLEDSTTIRLESLVPVGATAAPFIWVSGEDHRSLEDSLGSHPTVESVEKADELKDRSLYALDWSIEYDHLFRWFRDRRVRILSATCVNRIWTFALRFRTHKSLSSFQEYCQDARIDLDVARVYNLGGEDHDRTLGLTERQREALTLAVREGYYDIPRGCTTVELADWLDISDQAVTERLRRAIATLVRNTLMLENYPAERWQHG